MGPQVLTGGADAREGGEKGSVVGEESPILRVSVLYEDFINRVSKCQGGEMDEVVETLTTFAWTCLALPPPPFEP